MKRAPGLRDLSSEHHTGLVLVRRIARATAKSPAHAATVWDAVVERFRTELEPHFRKEEQGLLPALDAAGEHALVDRTFREHRAMRTLVAEGNAQDLPRFAKLLADHIRFEEKELFAVAQRKLPATALARLAKPTTSPVT